MEYQVSDGEINFAPDGEIFEILQNVRMIISTQKGTVPLDRDFGILWDFVDKPLPVAEMMMRSDVIDAVERYEPRATVVKVEFRRTPDEALHGRVCPIVTIKIEGDER